MDLELSFFTGGLIERQAVSEVTACNDYTQRFGLALSEAQAAQLVKARSHALCTNGRIEFGSGIIDRIIKQFCDSPYVSASSYADTLLELVELFYYFKNESMDLLSDDELITAMKTSFDGSCQGSVELLADRMDELAEHIRSGQYDGQKDDVLRSQTIGNVLWTEEEELDD